MHDMKCQFLKDISDHIYTIAWTVLVLSVILSVFVRSPFGFFDEQVHYIRALGVSNGQLLSYSKDNSKDKLGHDVSGSNLNYINKYLWKKDSAISTGWLGDKKDDETISESKEYSINTSAAPYTPVPYLSYAVGSNVAQMMNLGVKAEFLMMRLLGAITTLGIIFAAFRMAPKKYKWTVLAIALVPMCIATFASISTDGFTIAIILLFMATVASITNKIHSKTLKTRDIVILGLISILLVTAKIPAFLMIVLILAIIVVFRNSIISKHKIYLLLIIGITAIVTLLWAYYAKDINTGAFWGRNVDTMKQLEFIVSHPIVFMKNLIYSMLNYDYMNAVYLSYANNKFYTSLPFVVDAVVVAGLALSSFTYRYQKSPTIEQVRLYWIQVGIFTLVCFAIFTLLYLQFTPIATPSEIDGVQPRYFIPFIPLLIMIPYVLKLSNKWRKFAYIAPFIGVACYLMYLVMQLV